MALAGIEFSLDTIFMLVTLVAMETVLSADNAVALAALAQPIQDPCQRQQVLNWGLVIAFVLRVGAAADGHLGGAVLAGGTARGGLSAVAGGQAFLAPDHG